MMRLAADLHIHTVLSPCASRDMTPPAIVREALRRELDVIAVCDHNSAGNVEAVVEAAGALRGALSVIPCIEITTVEEVHVLGLFANPSSARAVGAEVTSGLPLWRPLAPRTSPTGGRPGPREPEQQLMDACGRQTGIEKRMLASASRFTLSAAVELIHLHGGIAVAAHLDRRSFSVLSQLGFMPSDVAFDGLEISAAGVTRGRAAEFAAYHLPLISSSDGHFLEDIGTGLTVLEVEEPVLREIVKAFQGIGGRRCLIA
jgi:3',5'-nucleoside bisphosphate phosphatase